MTLALLGGKPVIKDLFRRFNTIGPDEIDAARRVLELYPLSGFLGGEERGGPFVCQLEQEWAEAMGVKHAIATNSATSGLLAACAVAELGIESRVLTTPFTMSATSAAPNFFGARLFYGDIEPDTFCLQPNGLDKKVLSRIKAAIVTNLFGHPADLFRWRELSRQHGFFLIEDSAQTPFARIGQTGQIYAGTVGDIGVFSFNVHKHLQCGEGGMVVVPDDDSVALAVRHFINHGELAGIRRVGLNLRMTEVTAAIALEQLHKAPEIIAERQQQAYALSNIASQFDWITPPGERDNAEHVYYAWAAKINAPGIHRDIIVKAIRAEGFPLNAGYVEPLYRLPAFTHFNGPCPVTDAMHDRLLACFENCAWTLGDANFDAFGDILQKVQDNFPALRKEGA